MSLESLESLSFPREISGREKNERMFQLADTGSANLELPIGFKEASLRGLGLNSSGLETIIEVG
jgi:hypothetical protein